MFRWVPLNLLQAVAYLPMRMKPPVSDSLREIFTMVLPELSQAMGYKTPKTIN